MAKKKKKFDGAAVQEFFKMHGEKVGLIVVALISMLFIFAAVGQPSMPKDKHPDNLTKRVSLANDHISRTEVPESVATLGGSEGPKTAVDLESYSKGAELDLGSGDELEKRGKPKFLPVEELEVSTGRAAFAYQSRGRSRKAVGKHFVMLKGLVPVRKQRGAYNSVFEDAEKPAQHTPSMELMDKPRYYLYEVERAEVVPGESKLNWVPRPNAYNYMAHWADRWTDEVPELVDAKYIEPRLVHVVSKLKGLLPPILMRKWELYEVCHSKIVALLKSESGESGEFDDEPEGDEPEADAESDEFPDEDFTPKNSRKKRKESLSKEPGGGKLNLPKGSGPGLKGGEGTATASVEYRLFRYFDIYKVKPGKKYVYRVKLVLKNPNYQIPVRHLSDAALSKDELVTTSAVKSPEIQVPYDVEVLSEKTWPATSRINAPGQFRNEPGGRLRADIWDNAQAIEVSDLILISRGVWANEIKEVLNVPNPLGEQGKKGGMLKLRNFPVSTNHLVVDIRGGKRLVEWKGNKWQPGRDGAFTEPGEILLMDDRGNLIVRREIEDAAVIAKRTSVSETPEDKPNDPGRVFGDPPDEKKPKNPFDEFDIIPK